MRYNSKKSSKRAQLWIFSTHFFKFRAFITLHSPKQHVFLEFLVENKAFYSTKRALRIPHAINTAGGYSPRHHHHHYQHSIRCSFSCIYSITKYHLIFYWLKINPKSLNYAKTHVHFRPKAWEITNNFKTFVKCIPSFTVDILRSYLFSPEFIIYLSTNL